jgi:arabinogalactan endo-1,4-beta-galactosidase
VINAGFEAEEATRVPTGWRTSNETASDSEVGSYTSSLGGAHGGQWYGVQACQAANDSFCTSQRLVGLEPGLYTLSAWVRSSGGHRLCMLEASEFGGEPKRLAIAASADWKLIKLSEVPVTSGACVIAFRSSGFTGQWLHFDDIEFRQE